MRIGENYSFFPPGGMRAAVPGPAREILRPASESLESDSVSGAALVNTNTREARLEELRKSIQSGDYKIDVEEVSAAIVDCHVED